MAKPIGKKNGLGIPLAYKLAIICTLLFINAGLVMAADVIDIRHQNAATVTEGYLGYGGQGMLCSNFTINQSYLITNVTLKLRRLGVVLDVNINATIWKNNASAEPYQLVADATQNRLTSTISDAGGGTNYNFSMNNSGLTAGNYSVCGYRLIGGGTNTDMAILFNTVVPAGQYMKKSDDGKNWLNYGGGVSELYFNVWGSVLNLSDEVINITINNLSIYPSPNALTIDNLLAYAAATEYRGYNINYSWIMYVNQSKIFAYGTYNNSIPNITVNLFNVSYLNTTIGSNWTFSVKADTFNETTGWLNSSLTFVREFLIDNCTTYNYTIWNISYYDEYSLLPITALNTYDLIFSFPFIQHLSNVGGEKEYDTFCSSSNITGLYNITAYGSFKLEKTGYTTRIYNKDLASAYNIVPPKQNLSLYLVSVGNTSTVSFIIYDSNDKSKTISEAQMDMYQIILGSPVYMESRISDITGKTQFSYIAYKHYRFVVTKDGYTTYTFDLNPIQELSYDIFLVSTAILENPPIYYGLDISLDPTIYYMNTTQTFTFIITAPYGGLQSYGYTLTYPYGTNSNSGNNPFGSTLSTNFLITNATLGDKVIVDYFYYSNLSGNKSFKAMFPITISPGNNTMIALKTKTYGLGLFERLLILSFLMLLIVGIGALIGVLMPAVFLALIVMGYLTAIGFIPIWATITSFVLAVILATTIGGR